MSESRPKIPESEGNDASKRLPAAERRKQIVHVASTLLAERGLDEVRIPEVAERAGVTRAVVYRFFDSRQALLSAILDDFRTELERRFRARTGLLRDARHVDVAVRGFVEATCDAIEATGPGGFLLLSMDGLDPEIRSVALETRSALHEPWLARIANLTGVDSVLVTALSAMSVASSRAAIGLYLEGTLTRAQAAEVLSRGVKAMLEEFKR